MGDLGAGAFDEQECLLAFRIWKDQGVFLAPVTANDGLASCHALDNIPDGFDDHIPRFVPHAIVQAFEKVNAQLTISGGIAAFPIDAQDENELLRKADQALYKAKGSGRNKIVLAYEEKMSPKTSHYTLTQLERLSELAKEQGVGEAVLLREALDNLLIKYKHAFASRK